MFIYLHIYKDIKWCNLFSFPIFKMHMIVAMVQNLMQFVIESHLDKMFTKSLLKIDDITNHSKNESICQLFPNTAILVGFWPLFSLFFFCLTPRQIDTRQIDKPVVEIFRSQTILVCLVFFIDYMIYNSFLFVCLFQNSVFFVVKFALQILQWSLNHLQIPFINRKCLPINYDVFLNQKQ